MENQDKQLIEQYKSYFDKLQNGFSTKDYVGSKLIATNKSHFCENGSCKHIGQEILEQEKSEINKSKVEQLDSSVTSKISSNTSNNQHSSSNANNLISYNIPIKETKDYISSQGNQLTYLNRWQNTFFQNTMLATPGGFQRFNGMNRSLRLPLRKNNNFKFGNNLYNGLN